MEILDQIVEIIKKSKYLVIFTGAGISTESGLPDYRGPEGVWTLRAKGLKPKMPDKPYSAINPNVGHYVLVRLYKHGFLKYLISQNVDNLHIKSGIPEKIIAELHGNSNKMKCLICDKGFTKNEIGWNDAIHGRGYRTQKPLENQPKCSSCSGRLISSVVNFNDPMPEKEMAEAEINSKRADVMIVIGSTLSVFPAANFPIIAKNNGAILIIINLGPTELDHLADFRVSGKSGEVLSNILKRLEQQLDLES
ncbi:SIR2 family NAD-dependent protein deacylase [Candidatus Hodarchaeum mangrovi]